MMTLLSGHDTTPGVSNESPMSYSIQFSDLVETTADPLFLQHFSSVMQSNPSEHVSIRVNPFR